MSAGTHGPLHGREAGPEDLDALWDALGAYEPVVVLCAARCGRQVAVAGYCLRCLNRPGNRPTMPWHPSRGVPSEEDER